MQQDGICETDRPLVMNVGSILWEIAKQFSFPFSFTLLSSLCQNLLLCQKMKKLLRQKDILASFVVICLSRSLIFR